MVAPDRRTALDHVVVVMFENRSFDNLLGRLYQPGEVDAFEGVVGKELSNPIPGWAEHGADRKVVPYGISPTMNTPWPDPGEEFPHINTQLFGILDEANRGILQPETTFNTPQDPDQQPTMDGFLTDYISTFVAEFARQPTYDEYAQFMTGYTPEQMPVLSTLARGFATFDHWFCEVPSCTFPNRSFFHAATSSGYVVNMTPPESFTAHNTAETLFDRLQAHGLSWRVYCDPPSHYSLTGLIHAPGCAGGSRPILLHRPVLRGCRAGCAADLCVHRAADHRPRPQRHAPRLRHAHPRPHLGPAVVADRRRRAARPPLQRDPILVLPDRVELPEHHPGGDLRRARRHLRPCPPTPGGTTRPRSARRSVRLHLQPLGGAPSHPGISAWIPERTVVSEEYRATSVLATLRERWNLGAPFSGRDATARSLRPIFTLDQPRSQQDWPEVLARPVEPMTEALLPLDAPLNGLGKALFGGVLALGKGLGATVPDLPPDAVITGAQAIAIGHEVLGDLFPAMRS